MNAIPAGSITRRDGVLNLSSHSPLNSNPPDLGPKGCVFVLSFLPFRVSFEQELMSKESCAQILLPHLGRQGRRMGIDEAAHGRRRWFVLLPAFLYIPL
jgi:hypothetical protein